MPHIKRSVHNVLVSKSHETNFPYPFNYGFEFKVV